MNTLYTQDDTWGRVLHDVVPDIAGARVDRKRRLVGSVRVHIVPHRPAVLHIRALLTPRAIALCA